MTRKKTLCWARKGPKQYGAASARTLRSHAPEPMMNKGIAWALLAAAARAASTQQPVDLFFAIDAPYYLAMVACAMRAAYERTNASYRFFVLHRHPLTSRQICAAGRLALGSHFEGCSTFTHAREATSCALGQKNLQTVNTIELIQAPRVLDEIYRLTDLDFKSRKHGDCTNRGDLVNLFNLAPDAIDQFLLPLGVTRAVYLDADAWPDSDFVKFYDAASDDYTAVALARRRKRCVQAGSTKWERKMGLSGANWSEGFRQDLPYVYERLGRTLYDLDQRRWRADCFHVPSLKRYCELGVADKVVDALRRQTRGQGSKLWTCGLQQPPLLLALANRTAILRRDDLAVVDPAKGIEACAERNPKISVHSENKNSLRTRAMRREGGDRDAALGALLKRLESGDAEACGARPWREKKGAGGGGE